MKILHISYSDSGGAGKAAYRLHCGLRSIGLDSKMLVLRKLSDGDVEEFAHEKNFIKKVLTTPRKKLVRAQFNAYRKICPGDLEIFSDVRTIYPVSGHPLVREADIIHLHWIAEMIDYANFFPSVRDKTIFWTLHDKNPFTGGCHLSGSCTRYETGCGACPQLGSKDQNDLSRKIFEAKNEAYEGHKFNVVSPSTWLADCTRKSLLFWSSGVNVVPNGISTSTFTMNDKLSSRRLLDLPPDKTLILFGALNRSENKGLRYLIQALRLIRDRVDASGIALVTFGDCTEGFPGDVGFPVYQLGHIAEEKMISHCYSAVDVFVLPSLEENFPNMILESFACGIPVIGSDVGGVSDMVIPGETGVLVKAKDAEGLARQIIWAIEHPEERGRMGINAKKLVEREYALEVQAGRYRELYASALNK